MLLAGELQTSMLFRVLEMLLIPMSMICVIFFASSKHFVEVVITCFYVQKRNEHGITVWIYNKR